MYGKCMLSANFRCAHCAYKTKTIIGDRGASYFYHDLYHTFSKRNEQINFIYTEAESQRSFHITFVSQAGVLCHKMLQKQLHFQFIFFFFFQPFKQCLHRNEAEIMFFKRLTTKNKPRQSLVRLKTVDWMMRVQNFL